MKYIGDIWKQSKMNSYGHNWYFDKCCGNDDITLHACTLTYPFIPGRTVINFIIIIIIIYGPVDLMYVLSNENGLFI